MESVFDGKLLLSAPEAAATLSICEKSLWNFTVPRGTIPSTKIGSRVLYSRMTLQKWIAEQEAKEGENELRI